MSKGNLKKLNWGSGSIQPDGWVNMDKDPAFGADYAYTELWKEDNYFDIIVAHAVIQQIEWHEMVDQLKELHRILKPGGVLRISLPDILAGFYAYTLANKKFFPNAEEDVDDRFSAWLTWYSTSKTLLVQESLENKLKEAGFLDVIETEYKRSDMMSSNSPIADLDTRNKEFYFMEARK